MRRNSKSAAHPLQFYHPNRVHLYAQHTSAASGPFLKAVAALAIFLCLPLALFAKRAVPENLSNGLDKLVESNLAIKAGAPANFNAGPSTSQGVNQHRVNRINKGYNPAAPLDYPGTGISIGVMSDSFDASAATTDPAAADTAAGELPNVVVLEDEAFGSDPTDEGRGMAQIVDDVAAFV
jgi:hypothetical protein